MVYFDHVRFNKSSGIIYVEQVWKGWLLEHLLWLLIAAQVIKKKQPVTNVWIIFEYFQGLQKAVLVLNTRKSQNKPMTVDLNGKNHSDFCMKASFIFYIKEMLTMIWFLDMV